MATYKTIHTAYGLLRMAAAESTGEPINLVEVAIGDGAGNPVDPSMEQTQLVRERYRSAVNRVYRDPDNPLRYTVELVIPADIGGFTVRELGVFDDAGGLFVVGNTPESYKPLASEGAFGDAVLRIEFMVSNAEVVTLQIDPNVAVATQTWIINTVTPAWLLPGGTTGQVLTKQSNTDGDADWEDPDVANVVVDTIEETQTLAADQTIVDLAVCTVRGLSLYIDGHRLRKGDEWTPDIALDTRLTLTTAYPAGTKLVACQNEPVGSAPAPLERSKNLSDVVDKATARANLDIYSKAETDTLAPSGEVAFFARSTAPSGWLKCNGAAVSRAAYQRLFEAIGTTFGAGDGFNTFQLPDLRGEFLRGWDDGRGIDTGRTFGSWQAQQLERHKHFSGLGEAYTDPMFGKSASKTNFGSNGGRDYDNYLYLTSDGTPYGAEKSNPDGVVGTETRPRNHALLACIKY